MSRETPQRSESAASSCGRHYRRTFLRATGVAVAFLGSLTTAREAAAKSTTIEGDLDEQRYGVQGYGVIAG